MNARRKNLLSKLIVIVAIFLSGCDDATENLTSESTGNSKTLPFYGEFDIQFIQQADGSTQADTVYYPIPKFSFTNQFGTETSYKDYEHSITIAEFFFTECPSICPIMSSQMARIQELVKSAGLDSEVRFISFSVKPQNDTPEVLKAYGEKIGADFTNWSFVTGKAEDIYDLAQDGFMLTAFPSDSAEGGIFHTDKITLLDKNLYIRGYYDGTSTKGMDELFDDVKILAEKK